MRAWIEGTAWGDYALLDFGAGRRLERFGAIVVDRPAPMATGPRRRDAAAWARAGLRYNADACGKGPHPGSATRSAPGTDAGEEALPPGWSGSAPAAWVVSWQDLRFRLRPAAGGQVGLFPEQAPNWAWIRDRVRTLTELSSSPFAPSAPSIPFGAPKGPGAGVAAGRERPGGWDLRAGQDGGASESETETISILNGFAYTGGSTLAASAPGVAVVHVDGAKAAVAAARANAEASGLGARSIRWWVDDLPTVLAREIRRGRRYQGLILDPPAFGRGGRKGSKSGMGGAGGAWRLTRDLPSLLRLVEQLLAPGPAFLLLSCHPPEWRPADLAAQVAACSFADSGRLEAVALSVARADAGLPPGDGEADGPSATRADRLELGIAVRWWRDA